MTIHEIEKKAMCGDRAAVLILVSKFRECRATIEDMLDKRHLDGECDGATLYSFALRIEEILGEDDE